MPAEEKIIIALDLNDAGEAERIVRLLKPAVRHFKVGGMLFAAAGKPAVEMIKENGCEVFLDLKLHDIPNTVEGVSREIALMGVKMFDVHASGGSGMVKAALKGASSAGGDRPLLLAVTVLTHLKNEHLAGELGLVRDVEEHVLELAQLSIASGADGVICSPLEISPLRRRFGDEIIIVTPGVRPEHSSKNDQGRTLTPGRAVSEGADYIVIGRPVLEAPDPRAEIDRIIGEIETAG